MNFGTLSTTSARSRACPMKQVHALLSFDTNGPPSPATESLRRLARAHTYKHTHMRTQEPSCQMASYASGRMVGTCWMSSTKFCHSSAGNPHSCSTCWCAWPSVQLIPHLPHRESSTNPCIRTSLLTACSHPPAVVFKIGYCIVLRQKSKAASKVIEDGAVQVVTKKGS